MVNKNQKFSLMSINSSKQMWIGFIWCPATRTKATKAFLYMMPTPHADLHTQFTKNEQQKSI